MSHTHSPPADQEPSVPLVVRQRTGEAYWLARVERADEIAAALAILEGKIRLRQIGVHPLPSGQHG